MQAWILEIIERFGYLAVGLLIALENLFPPIPSEIILTFGGYLTTQTALRVWGVAVVATMGSLAGAAVLYGVGRVLGGGGIHALARRVPGVGERDVDRALRWFERFGGKAVFFCRMVPLVRSLISIPAGVAGMPLGAFLLLSAGGSFIWNALLAAAGALLGQNWERLALYIGVYAQLILGLLFLGAAALLYRLATRVRGKR